jgi:phosphoglycerate dehydrogenase-like enzyme
MKVLIGSNPMGLEKAIPDLQHKYPAVEFVHCANNKDLPALIADADVYMGWLNHDVFVAGKKLKWIQSPSSGIDYYLAIPELAQSDVLLCSARGTHGACLAESALAMILAFTRGVRASVLAQPQRKWALGEIRPYMVEFTGSTLGIIGFGMVGRSLAERARVFGTRIIAVDMFPGSKPDYVAELGGLERLNDLLRTSDYVVVTVPRTPENRNLIGAAQLALMKPNAMLVGISRGGIIDQVALAQALRAKTIAAAALDVFEPEPLPADNELWGLDNLLIMPHVAGGTQFEGQYVLDIFYENLERFIQGNLPLRNQIDKVRGF